MRTVFAVVLLALSALAQEPQRGAYPRGRGGPVSGSSSTTTNTFGFDGGAITASVIDAGSELVNGQLQVLGTIQGVGSNLSGTEKVAVVDAGVALINGQLQVLGPAVLTSITGAPTATLGTITMGTNQTINTGTGGHIKLGADATIQGNGNVLCWFGTGDATISSGFGTSPSITTNFTCSFTIVVGSSPGSTGTIGLPDLGGTKRYGCGCTNITSNASLVVEQSGGTSSSCVMTSYARNGGAVTAFNASDELWCWSFGRK